MSELEPGQHDEIARRLRDEGPAQAPPDIAAEVMRRVRSEPRPARRVRGPLTNLLAAAVILAALVVGIAKLGGTGSGSASGGGSVAETTSSGGVAAAPVKHAYAGQSLVIAGVPVTALHGAGAIDALGPVYDSAKGCPNGLLAQRRGVTLFVPAGSFSAVQQQLQSAKALTPYDTLRVRVRLRRAAAGAATAYSITCP
ncbi:MAG: hypothetical protein QOF08_1229 [Gaiellales bacterium]|jgi:hypothetical protein|nr:hypothetical protein [Gaiellales bacterium]